MKEATIKQVHHFTRSTRKTTKLPFDKQGLVASIAIAVVAILGVALASIHSVNFIF